MVSGGSLQFSVRLDLSTLRGEKVKVENFLKRNPVKIPVQLQADRVSLNALRRDIRAQSKSIRINTQIDTKPIQNLKSNLGGVNTEAGRLNALIAGFASAGTFIALDAAIDTLRATTRALVGVFTEAVGEFAKFEASLASFASRAQGTNVDLASLESQIKAVAQATSFTPAGLADAATQLVALGVPAQEVEGRLDSLAKTADVLGEDPVITGRVLQGALEQYAKFGESADSVSDILVKLINTTAAGSRSGIAEFEQLFSRAAPTAATLGVSLEELTAAFAGLRQTGATAQVSASTLDAVLTRLATSADELSAQGIELQFKADGALDLEATLIAIRERIDGLTAQQQVDFLAGIFGNSRGGDVLALINSVEGAFGSALESAENAQGSLQETFDIVSDSLQFQAGILQGQIATAFTELGAAISPVARGFVELGQNIFEAANVDLSGLASAAERLEVALTQNPELAQRLAEAFSNLAQTGVDQFSQLLDAVTAFAGNADAVDGLAQSIEDIGIAIRLVVRIAQGLIGVTELFFQQGSVLENLNSNLRRTTPLYRAIADAIGLISAAFEFLQNPLQSTADFLESLIEKFDVLANSPVIQALLEQLRGANELQQAVNVSGSLDRQVGRGLEVAQQGIRNEQIRQSQPDILPDPQQTESDTQGAINSLEKLRDEQDAILSEIETRAAQSAATLTQQGAGEEELANRERQALQERLSAQETFLAELKALQESGGLSAEDAANVEKAILDTEQAIANDRLQVAQSVRDGKIKAAKDAADKVIEQIERENDTRGERAQQQFDDQTRSLQRNFDDQSERRKIETENRVNEIKARGEAEANRIKEEGEARVQELSQAFEERQQRKKQDFQDKQQADQRAFEEELRRFRDGESRRIDTAASRAEFQTNLRLAQSPEERQRLIDERKAAEERAKILAEEQRKALRTTGANDVPDLTPIEQARVDLEDTIAAKQDAFRLQQQEEAQAFEAQLQQEKIDFENGLAELKKQNALEVAQIEESTASQVEAIKQDAAQTERDLDRAFQDQLLDRERAFNEEQRRLDEASAQRIEQIRRNAERGIAPAQSLRSGGVVEGTAGSIAPVQLHKDEFTFAPVGTRVVSQSESRRLVQAHLAATMPNIPAIGSIPSIQLPTIGAGLSGAIAANDAGPITAAMGKRMLRTLEEIRDAGLQPSPATFNISTSQAEVDIYDIERKRMRARFAGMGF